MFIDQYLLIIDNQPISPVEPFELLDRIFVHTDKTNYIVKLFEYPFSIDIGMHDYILGITRQGHDSSAAIIDGTTGQVVAFEREERTRRVKHARDFPTHAITSVMKIANIQFDQISAIAVGHSIHWFEDAPSSKSPGFIKFTKLGDEFIKKDFGSRHRRAYILTRLQNVFPQLSPLVTPIFFIEHHIAHAASMPIDSNDSDGKSLFLVMDGRGEWDTITTWLLEKGDLKCKLRVGMPNSLGYLYNMMGRFMGWREFGFEGQIMGLAPYGKPRNSKERRFYKLITKVYQDFAHVSSKTLQLILKRKYFDGGYRPERLANISGWVSPYVPSQYLLDLLIPYTDPLPGGTQIDPDNSAHRPVCILAYTLQCRTQELILSIIKGLKLRFPQVERLHLSGGVALNITTNGEIIRQGLFTDENLITTPFPGDDGLSIGSALFLVRYFNKDRKLSKPYDSALLGCEFGLEDVRDVLNTFGLIPGEDYQEYASFMELVEATVDLLESGNGIAWFQGREEAGPRALGARSILFPVSDSSSNLRANKAKQRQPWRPTAISILEEDARDMLEYYKNAPYMSIALSIQPEYKNLIKAGLHPVDESTRPQVVKTTDTQHLYKLLKCLKARTGTGVLLNTSFNRAEPIVHWPDDALNTLYYLEGVEFLAISNFLVRKGKYKPSIIALREEPDFRQTYKEYCESGDPVNIIDVLLNHSMAPHQVKLLEDGRWLIPMYKEGFDKKVLAPILKHLHQDHNFSVQSNIIIQPSNNPYVGVLTQLINEIIKGQSWAH